MADTTIHALPDGVAPQSGDEFYVVRSPYGASDERKVTFAEILTRTSEQAYYPASGDTTGATDAGQTAALLSSRGSVRLGPGTHWWDATRPTLGDYAQIQGSGRGKTVIKLANGANVDVITNSDQVNGNKGVRVKDFTIDGNKANQTGTRFGVFFKMFQDCESSNLEIANIKGGYGLRYDGNQNAAYSRRNVAHKIFVHGCDSHGVAIQNAARETSLRTIRAYSNAGLGAYLDVSELIADDIYAYQNSDAGVYIHNVFGCNIGSIVSYLNAKEGVKVMGMVNSVGGAWLAQNNSHGNVGVSDDFYFSGDNDAGGGYGITDRTLIASLVSGYFATGGTDDKRYGIYVDDAAGANVWADFKIANAYVATAGQSGRYRIPAAAGNIVLGPYFPAGSATVQVVTQ